jgi:glycerophosphoryl diester phosphodiesterase
MKPPLVIAHRGDSAHRPENTLAAFAAALEVGVSVVELDVQLTADGEVVVLHDATLERTTTGHGDVRRLRLAELRALSAGYPSRFGAAWQGERVPLLVEALALVKDRARVLIEVKTESVTAELDGGVEARALAIVRRLGMSDSVAFISFDQRALVKLKTLAPEITRGRLFGRTSAAEIERAAAEASLSLVMPHKGQLNDALVERVSAAGLMLATWVVDDPSELKRLSRFPLYGVGSNCPGVLLDALADGLLEA